MSGTTATLAVHDHRTNKITVAHVADARPKADSTAVLGTKNGNSWEGVALTRDHKPNLKDEKQRASVFRDGGGQWSCGEGSTLYTLQSHWQWKGKL
eukprot:Skav217811  [mRNA]  locus=scaffold889:59038:60129:+ [translate_table: standard]